jgi:hypothetical protein
MPRLSLGLGVQAVRKVKAGAAPSGIPVAGTSIVTITNAGVLNNGTYTKKTPEQALVINSSGHSSYLKTGVCYLRGGIAAGNLLLSPDAQVWDDEVGAILDSPFGAWKFINAFFDGDLDSWVYSVISSNSSVNTDYIPDASWSPAITITAA